MRPDPRIWCNLSCIAREGGESFVVGLGGVTGRYRKGPPAVFLPLMRKPPNPLDGTRLWDNS